MRTTDFCFPLPDYEYPRLVSSRYLFEACASPLANELALVTRRPVDLAVSRCQIRFGGPFEFDRAACFFRALSIEPYL